MWSWHNILCLLFLALFLAYTNGAARLCRELLRAGGSLATINKHGVSIFNAQVPTKKLLYTLLGECKWGRGSCTAGTCTYCGCFLRLIPWRTLFFPKFGREDQVCSRRVVFRIKNFQFDWSKGTDPMTWHCRFHVLLNGFKVKFQVPHWRLSFIASVWHFKRLVARIVDRDFYLLCAGLKHILS